MNDVSAAASVKSTAPEKSAPPKRAVKSAAKPATQPAAKTVKATVKAKAIKAVKPTKTKPAAPAPAVKAATPKAAAQIGQVQAKQKLVRDSFTMPSNDFGLIHTLKERTLGFRRPTKKSELLRAGLHALFALNDAKLRSVLEGLAPLKSGRPKKAD